MARARKASGEGSTRAGRGLRTPPRRSSGTQRLDREAWFEHGLRVLRDEGAHAMRVEVLARHLGVTKGSLYWHFRDREDFLRQMIGHWSDAMTESVVAEVARSAGSARERLELLMHAIETRGLDRFDLAVRALAAVEPSVLRILRRLDERRFAVVKGLFRELGFRGADLEMRARAFVACEAGQRMSSTVPISSKRRASEMRRLRLDLLVGPAATKAGRGPRSRQTPSKA